LRQCKDRQGCSHNADNGSANDTYEAVSSISPAHLHQSAAMQAKDLGVSNIGSLIIIKDIVYLHLRYARAQ
jgi:hypothetical protein